MKFQSILSEIFNLFTECNLSTISLDWIVFKLNKQKREPLKRDFMYIRKEVNLCRKRSDWNVRKCQHSPRVKVTSYHDFISVKQTKLYFRLFGKHIKQMLDYPNYTKVLKDDNKGIMFSQMQLYRNLADPKPYTQ